MQRDALRKSRSFLNIEIGLGRTSLGFFFVLYYQAAEIRVQHRCMLVQTIEQWRNKLIEVGYLTRFPYTFVDNDPDFTTHCAFHS